MLQLLQNYSIPQILIFIVFLAAAIKGIVTFFEWLQERIKKSYEKQNKPYKNAIKNKQQDRQLQQIQEEILNIQKDMKILMQSDKDAIKFAITKEHHYFCYELGFIDDYSLDCLERRYAHYKDQGGNSFIAELMADLRTLPKRKITSQTIKEKNI